MIERGMMATPCWVLRRRWDGAYHRRWYEPGGGGAAWIRLGGGASGGEWRGSAEVVQTRGDGSGVAVRTRWGWRLLDPWHGMAVTRGWLQVVASTI